MVFLHDPVTLFKIAHAGTQVARWDFKNIDRPRCTKTMSCFVSEIPLCSMLPSRKEMELKS